MGPVRVLVLHSLLGELHDRLAVLLLEDRVWGCGLLAPNVVNVMLVLATGALATVSTATSQDTV